MQKRFCRMSLVGGLLLTAACSYAVDVVVNSTQPEVAGVSYQTINGALNYVKTQAEPRTVRITGGGPYQESPLINFSVTLKGDNYKPILTVPGTTGAPNTNLNGFGISLFTTSDFPGSQKMRLENMTIIPKVGASVTRAIRTNNNATSLSTDPFSVELVDILVTANNGSNLPVSTDGLTTVSLAGATNFTDDGIFCAGIVDVACTGTIVTHLQGSSTSPDGLVFFPDEAGHRLHIGPGCVFSYMKRLGIQLAADGSDVTIEGSTTQPVVLKGNFINNTGVRNPALAMFLDNENNPAVFQSVKNTVFIENNSTVIGGWSVDPGQSASAFTVDHCAFVGNGECAINYAANSDQPFTLKNSTIVKTGGFVTAAGQVEPVLQFAESTVGASTGVASITDSIIAGNGTDGNTTTGANLIAISTTAKPITFSNSALVASGPYKLGTGIFKLSPTALPPVQTNVKSQDPQFALVSSAFTNSNFLDVAQVAYDNAGTAGSDLSGYGDYVGGSSVNNWSLY